MRWLFYIPKPRSKDGLLRRRPVWPRRLIRRSTRPYARRRFDHAEVGQLAYHVTLVVLLLFGCRMGTLVTMTLSESPWALQINRQLRGIDPPVAHTGEKPEQRRLLYDVVLNQEGREVPFPTTPDTLVEAAYSAAFGAAYGIELPAPRPLEPTQQPFANYDPPPLDSMTTRQRLFAARLSEEPRMILTITADRRTPIDSVFALISDARVAGMQRFFLAVRRPYKSPRMTTQP